MIHRYDVGDILLYSYPNCDPFHILIEEFVAGDTVIDGKCWGIDIYKVRFLEDNDFANVEQYRLDTNPHYTKVG